MYVIRDKKRLEVKLSELKHTQRERVYFKCDKCGEPSSKIYRDKTQFDEGFLCKNCKKKQTNLEKHGTENYTNGDKISKSLKNKNENEKKKIIKKRKETKLQKYGDENYTNKEKAFKTNFEKYGVKTGFQTKQNRDSNKKAQIKRRKEKEIDFRDSNTKRKETCIEKYGVEHILKLQEYKDLAAETKLKKYGDKNYNNREKATQTNIERYGYYHHNQNDKIKEKIRKTQIEKYGAFAFNTDKQKETRFKNFYYKLINSNRLKDLVEPQFDINEYNGHYNIYNWKCKKCGNIFPSNIEDGTIPRCYTCFPREVRSSQYEEEIIRWLSLLGIESEHSNRTIIYPKELDILIPDHNIAIEFNGLYWHSELNGKDKYYHLQKTIDCEKQGIDLIHIFEDEWIDKQDIVKSIIKGKLGLNTNLYARKCILKEINSREVFQFYEENHLQGGINSSINIGLFYEGDLVSALSFSKPRYNKDYNYEITRFANKLDISVIGGFAKMLKYFRKKYSGSIITYSDRRYFNGSIYKNNGFIMLESSNPSYYYTDYRNRYNRVGFQKHKLEKNLEYYDSKLTEWQNMQLNGWDRIYDCGNLVFKLKSSF